MLHRSGNLADAATLYKQLLSSLPDHPEALNGLATLALQQGNVEEGVRLLDLSLKVAPNQPLVLCNRGAGLQSLGRLDEALACYDRALALKHDFAEAYSNRGLVLAGLERWNEALASCESALALRPDYAEAHNNRGIALQRLKRFEEALACFDRVIALKPGNAETFSNRGYVLCELARWDEALASCDRAIALQPSLAMAQNNRGVALQSVIRLDDALASFDRAIALKPDYVEAHCNRGRVLSALRRWHEALACYDRAIALKPDFADAHWEKSMLKLALGAFEEGWKLYEWRWQGEQRAHVRTFPQPLWLGEHPLIGKTIFIHAEQGFGDFIQFCRYVPMVEALGANVVLEAPAALIPLVKTLAGGFRIVKRGDPLPSFDLHCPIMSLPLAFATTVESIPAKVPYLFVDAGKKAAWHRRLGATTKPRIGLAWSGSPTQHNDRRRSMPLQTLEPLLRLPIEFHALQTEIRPGDAAYLQRSNRVHLHQDELRDFSDTAALTSEMDLVISVCTSVAHLAGALGKSVWILLPAVPSFRWMLDRPDSPWYPSATLVRQPAIGDWGSVVAEIVRRLEASISKT